MSDDNISIPSSNESFTFSIPSSTENSTWQVKDDSETNNDNYTLKSDESIKVDVDSSLDLGGSTMFTGTSGTISVQPDPEKREELQELAETQRQKLGELRDQIINYIASNDLARGDVEQWKRDLETIDDYRDQISGDRGLTFPGFIDQGSVLDPSQLDELNEIYDRWR